MSKEGKFIWLASYPRSGNTLLRRLIHILTGWNTYSVYGDPRLKDRRGIGHVGINDIDRFMKGWTPRTFAPYPMFCKTHERPSAHGSRHPAVLLVRDARDVIVSYAHYLAHYEERPFAGILDRAIQGTTLKRGGWDTHVNMWLKMKPVVILKFEDILFDMNRSPEIPVVKLFDALGIPTDIIRRDRHVPTFKELHEADPNFYRSGHVGQWRSELTDKQLQLFWRIHGKVMDKLGYERD